MGLDFHADMQNALVRMIVPMRREFGCALDVQQMRRDPTYAESIVAQALTSHTQNLRDCARLVGYHLSAAKAAQAPAASPTGHDPASTDVHHDAALAARLLIDLIGPMGEPLAIRIERAADAPALAQLIGQARACIAGVRGEAAASGYVRQTQRTGANASRPARAGDAAQRRVARHAARELLELIGPLGKELAERMERCGDSPALLALIAEAHDGITAVIGAAAAHEFAQRVTPQRS